MKDSGWNDLLRIREVRHFLTGAALVASAIVFATAVVAYLMQNDLFEPKYRVYALFDDGTGMSRGAKVLVNGVQVGTVEDVRLSPSAQVVLVLALKQRYNLLIRRNSVAYYKRDRNMVSDRVLNIEKGDLGSPMLHPGDTLRLDAPQDIETALGSLANLTAQFRQTLTRVDSLLKLTTDTNTTIGALLVKDDLYRRTMSTISSFDKVARHGSKSLEQLDQVSGVVRTEVPRILYQTDTLAVQLRRTSNTAESLGTAGLQLVRSGQTLADRAQGIARKGDDLVDKGNRLMNGVERSWLLGGFMAPADPPDGRVPVGPLP